jgi:hypothetical protein
MLGHSTPLRQPISPVGVIRSASVHSGFTVNSLAVFAGALAAELHLAVVTHGTKRVASLRTRRLEDYVGSVLWWLPVLSATVGVPVVVVARGSTVWIVTALLVLVVVVVVRQRVLLRAQPAGEPDVVLADDAVRARSLHVLSGGGYALVCFCLLAGFREHPEAAIAWLGILVTAVLAANSRGLQRDS